MHRKSLWNWCLISIEILLDSFELLGELTQLRWRHDESKCNVTKGLEKVNFFPSTSTLHNQPSFNFIKLDNLNLVGIRGSWRSISLAVTLQTSARPVNWLSQLSSCQHHLCSDPLNVELEILPFERSARIIFRKSLRTSDRTNALWDYLLLSVNNDRWWSCIRFEKALVEVEVKFSTYGLRKRDSYLPEDDFQDALGIDFSSWNLIPVGNRFRLLCS